MDRFKPIPGDEPTPESEAERDLAYLIQHFLPLANFIRLVAGQSTVGTEDLRRIMLDSAPHKR